MPPRADSDLTLTQPSSSDSIHLGVLPRARRYGLRLTTATWVVPADAAEQVDQHARAAEEQVAVLDGVTSRTSARPLLS